MDDEPTGPSKILRCEDHYCSRWNALSRRHVWSVKHERPLACLGTLFTLGALHSALRMINSFEPLGVDDYAVELHDGRDDCHAPATTPPSSHGGPIDMLLRNALSRTRLPHAQRDAAALIATCHTQLYEHGEPEALRVAREWYWYAAHALIILAIAFDILRYSGLSVGVGDLLLGFHSPQREARRMRPYWLVLVPLLHLSYLYTRPIDVPCCVATPRLDGTIERLRTLVFLTLVSTYFLLGDAHNHGYFLLRIPGPARDANALLRPALTTPPPRLEGHSLLGADAAPV